MNLEDKQKEPDYVSILVNWYLKEKEKEKKALTEIRAETMVGNNVNRP